MDVAVLPDLVSKELFKENEKLKMLLGEKDLEIAILRDLIKKKNPDLLKNGGPDIMGCVYSKHQLDLEWRA
jgi:transposase